MYLGKANTRQVRLWELMNREGFYETKHHNEKKTRYHARQRTVGNDAGGTGSIGQKHS
jgi:hypothetical protein